MKVPYVFQAIAITVSRSFRKTHTANICGHVTKKKGFIKYGDSTVIMEMPLEDNGHPDYCLDCISKMTIRCAWCGEPIVIGSPITLYLPTEGLDIPDHAVRYSEGKEQALVGCLRWDCAHLANMSGYWMPPGEVERVISPLELCIQTGAVITVDNIQKYPESVGINPID